MQRIIDHRKNKKSYDYLVKWSDYSNKFNSWVKTKDFDNLGIINKYWKEMNKTNEGEKRQPLKSSKR